MKRIFRSFRDLLFKVVEELIYLLKKLWKAIGVFLEAVLVFFRDLWFSFSAAGKIALILLAFVLFSVSAGLFFVVLYTGASEDTMVPDVVGMNFVDAYRMAHERKLEVAVRTRTFTDAPPGTVLSQSLPPGLMVSEGREIELVVAGEKKSARMPSLVGKKISYALKILEPLKIKPVVLEVYSSSPVDTVLAQYPSRWTRLKKEGRVLLVVSRGEEKHPFPLPNLVGRPYTENLRNALTKLGVDFEVNYVESKKAQPGIIVSQSLPPGTFYRFDKKLILQVAR